MRRLIVSRPPATVAYRRETLGWLDPADAPLECVAGEGACPRCMYLAKAATAVQAICTCRCVCGSDVVGMGNHVCLNSIEHSTDCAPFPCAAEVPSLPTGDLRGAVVAGNLPLHLAVLAAEVIAVEFTGNPPRGAEYGRAEMEAAGVGLTRYRVAPL